MLSCDPKSLRLKRSFLKDENFYQFPEPTMQTLFGLDIAPRLHRILRWRTVTQICQSNLPRERTLECFVREATPPGAIGHSDGENSVGSAYYQLMGVITDSQKHVIHF